MRALLLALGTGLGLGAAPVHAHAERVRSQRSFWDASQTTIHTEIVVERDDGRQESVRLVGGTVDGVGMVQLATGTGAIPFAGRRSSAGKPLRWPDSCVSIHPASEGTTHVPDNDEVSVIAQVLETWNRATRSCGYLSLVLDSPVDDEVGGRDKKNVIKFREDSWCRPGDPQVCYDPAILGITTVAFIDKPGDPRDGEIFDADIEINAALYAISVDARTLGQQREQTDLANVLTHEVGHLVGLEHTCWDGVSVVPLDGDGNPVPSCDDPNLASEILETTMYPFQEPGETKRASLEADDIAGYCALYPRVNDPLVCEVKKDEWFPGGCRSAPGDGKAPLVLVLLAILGRRPARPARLVRAGRLPA